MIRQRLAAIPLGIAWLALKLAKRVHPKRGSVFIRHATNKTENAIEFALERGLYAKSQLESEDQHGS